MIDDLTKNSAIKDLKLKIPIEDVSSKYALPVKLVQEWHDTIDDKDFQAIESNLELIEKISTLELDTSIDAQQRTRELIKIKLEALALDITNELTSAVSYENYDKASALTMCTGAISKLYSTFVPIEKEDKPIDNAVILSSEKISKFKSLMKD